MIGEYTVAEAKDRWCPLVRVPDHGARAAVNSDGTQEPAKCRSDATLACIAHRCALWRPVVFPRLKSIVHEADMRAVTEPPRPANIPASWTWSPYDESEGEPPSWTEPEAEAMQRVRGYCGAGGPLFGMLHQVEVHDGDAR